MDAIICALIAAASASIVAPIVTYAVGRQKSHDVQDGALQMGMRALLWRELHTLHHAAVERGGMTVEERRHLEGVYQPYHEIGGNGTGTRLYEDAMKLPVIE